METGGAEGREKWFHTIPHMAAFPTRSRAAKRTHLFLPWPGGASMGGMMSGAGTGSAVVSGTSRVGSGLGRLAAFCGSRVISGMYDPRGRLIRNSEVTPYFP